jgi:hypothetical protein
MHSLLALHQRCGMLERCSYMHYEYNVQGHHGVASSAQRSVCCLIACEPM